MDYWVDQLRVPLFHSDRSSLEKPRQSVARIYFGYLKTMVLHTDTAWYQSSALSQVGEKILGLAQITEIRLAVEVVE